jgi:hypothetical protein
MPNSKTYIVNASAPAIGYTDPAAIIPSPLPSPGFRVQDASFGSSSGTVRNWISLVHWELDNTGNSLSLHPPSVERYATKSALGAIKKKRWKRLLLVIFGIWIHRVKILIYIILNFG